MLKIMVLTRRSLDHSSDSRMKTPARSMRDPASSSANGIATPSAHGQDTTKIEIITCNACAKPAVGNQNTKLAIPHTMIASR